MSPRTPWSGQAQSYDRSFGRLCHGAAGPLLDAVSNQLPDFDPASAPRLLDIGCGTGLLAIAAAGRGFAVTAADADADMTALAEVDFPWRIDPEDL